MTAAPRGVRVVLALLVWFSCAWFGSWELNPNNATRMFAAITLAEDGTARIDKFAAFTIDKAQFGAHTYLDKAPGMTLMAMPAVWLADAATGERADPNARTLTQFPDYLRLRQRLAVAIGPALLTAIAAVLLFELGSGLTGSGAAGLVAALGYGLGTPAWGWSTTVFGHAAVGALYVIALWALWRGGERERAGLYAWAGAALGWAVVVEYQAVLAGGVLAVFGVAQAWRSPRRWRLLAAAAVAGVIAMLPLAAYNLLAFGTVFRVGYAGVVGFEGMNQGLFGLTAPSPRVLWEIVFGTERGLLWVAPVLVVAPLGLGMLAEVPRRGRVAWAAGVAAIVVLLVNAAYVYWDGGNATGPRHSVPALGMLAIGLAPFWAGLRSTAARRATAALLALSIAINLLIAACDMFAPPTERFELAWVWREHLMKGDITSVAGDYWGWPEWTGVVVWAAVALPAIAWLVRVVLRRQGPHVTVLSSA